MQTATEEVGRERQEVPKLAIQQDPAFLSSNHAGQLWQLLMLKDHINMQ